MKKSFSIAVLGILIGFAINGCKNSNREKDPQRLKSEKYNFNEKTKQSFCFRNEYLFKKNPRIKDIQELMLEIDDKSNVTGIYNWLPAEKDQREGTLKGKVENNIVEAKYTYIQEGIKDSTTISITLEKDKAIIEGGKRELGLGTSIKKIDCENFHRNEKSD